jgi:hypothetical protein
VSYEDLIELARLCLRQAAATRNQAAAAELRRMASDYQARAAALDAARAPTPQPALQQQQPQREGSDSGDGGD